MCHGRHRLRLAMLGAVLALSVLAPADASAASLPRTADSYPWLLDGDVHALARSGNTVYLGGDFRYIGPRLAGLAKLGPSGAPDLGFPTVDGYVRTAEPDGSGGWYVGGSFSEIGGVQRSSLAHVLSDGRVDPDFVAAVAGESTTGEVLTLASAGGTLYIGGAFTNVDGVPRANLAAVDAATGTLVGSWVPEPDGDVRALKASGSKLFVGGRFSTLAGSQRAGLAAFDTATGGLDAWAPALSQPNVTALEVSPSSLYVAGDFQQVGAAARGCLAAFDLGTGALTPWAPAADGPFDKLSYAATTDTLYVSGAPHWVANRFAYLVGLDAHTGAAVPGTPWTGGYTTATVAGGTLYLASNFDDDPGPAYDMKHLLLGIDLANGEEVFRAQLPASTGGGGEVRTIAVQGGDVVVGGWFASIGGLPRDRLAAVDLVTGEPTGWDPGADGSVRALAVAGGAVVAGGDFAEAGGAARARLAALETSGGSATAWSPQVSGGNVRALALDGGTVYAGGSFTGVDAQPRHGVAAIDLATGAVTDWAPQADGGSVLAIARSGGTTFLGGSFTKVGGEAHSQLAAVDADGRSLPGWRTAGQASDGEVRALLLDAGTLFVGGTFTTLDGQSRLDIGAVDPVSGDLSGWDAKLSAGIAVNALAASGGELYLGGSRTPDFWDTDEAIFARLRESDGTKLQDLVAVDSVIDAIWASPSSVLIGGSFQWIDYHPNKVRGFASFTFAPQNSSTPTISGAPSAGETLTCSTGTWDGNPLMYAYQWRRDGHPLAGETAATYVVGPDDVGHLISCAVSARNPGGSSTAESGPAGGPPPPASMSAPTISGVAEYEQLLSCAPGDWSGGPTGYDYQWLRGGDPIMSAGASTYRITAADATKDISCQVTAAGPGGRARAFSQPVTPPPGPGLISAPVISGTALPGETLTCTSGSWDSTTPLSYSYQWWGSQGALGSEPQHTILESERGDSLACVVTARNGGGVRTEVSLSVVVPLLPPANSSRPRIIGQPLAGRTLTCDPGSWTGADASHYEYQWTIDGEQHWTLNPAQFTPAAEDRGKVLLCIVTAHNANWVATSAQSDEITVGWDAPASSAAPAVRGTPLPGSTLTCDPGTWSDVASFDFAWLRDSDATIAAGATYSVSERDRGHALSCRVTASGPGGVAVAGSAALRVPDAGPTSVPVPNETVSTATPPPGVSVTPPRSSGQPTSPLRGTNRAEAIIGSAGADLLHGFGGNDRLVGAAGPDRLFGDAGDDVLEGGSGNDLLVGGTGADRLDGGPGADTLDARDGRPHDRVSCGPGRDVVKADLGDRVARDCESIRWVKRTRRL